ncbi:MAG: hypothetical protein J3Q66DRAFT_372972 [Benniella sp.]|nr:MAG: hypothetical protein J3Q66DRAFT_372972 [Benniella sp.]
MESPQSTAIHVQPQTSSHTVLNIDSDPVPAQSYSPLKFKPASERTKSPVRYCCCCPVASGTWVIPFFLIIPSLALVLSFNVANVQKFVQFRSPSHVRIVYTIIYSLYLLLGIGTGVALRRLSINRRLQTLIWLYWILITATVVEGVYFGIMMSKQKNKLVSYCEDPPTMPTVPGTNNNTISKSHTAAPNAAVCHRMHALIGVFYIVGPGGWLILHCGWILIVVLYSKALRRQHPVDDELVMVKGATGATAKHAFGDFWRRRDAESKGKTIHEMELTTGTYTSQQHPFQRASPSGESNPRLGAMFRNMKSNSLQHIGVSEGKEVGQDEDRYGSDPDDMDATKKPGQSGGSIHDSMASRTDVPADGKGWWIRQIEGKRRGEICPCTRGLQGPNAQESCWCGKERLACHTRSLRAESSSGAGPSGSSPRSLNSHSPTGHSGDELQNQDQAPAPTAQKDD